MDSIRRRTACLLLDLGLLAVPGMLLASVQAFDLLWVVRTRKHVPAFCAFCPLMCCSQMALARQQVVTWPPKPGQPGLLKGHTQTILSGFQPSGSLAFELFSLEWGFPFNPLKVKLLAGDLRTAQDP